VGDGTVAAPAGACDTGTPLTLLVDAKVDDDDDGLLGATDTPPTPMAPTEGASIAGDTAGIEDAELSSGEAATDVGEGATGKAEAAERVAAATGKEGALVAPGVTVAATVDAIGATFTLAAAAGETDEPGIEALVGAGADGGRSCGRFTTTSSNAADLSAWGNAVAPSTVV
jgi:hypothetical protein